MGGRGDAVATGPCHCLGASALCTGWLKGPISHYVHLTTVFKMRKKNRMGPTEHPTEHCVSCSPETLEASGVTRGPGWRLAGRPHPPPPACSGRACDPAVPMAGGRPTGPRPGLSSDQSGFVWLGKSGFPCAPDHCVSETMKRQLWSLFPRGPAPAFSPQTAPCLCGAGPGHGAGCRRRAGLQVGTDAGRSSGVTAQLPGRGWAVPPGVLPAWLGGRWCLCGWLFAPGAP